MRNCIAQIYARKMQCSKPQPSSLTENLAPNCSIVRRQQKLSTITNQKTFWAALEGWYKYKSCSLFWQFLRNFFFRGQSERFGWKSSSKFMDKQRAPPVSTWVCSKPQSHSSRRRVWLVQLGPLINVKKHLKININAHLVPISDWGCLWAIPASACNTNFPSGQWALSFGHKKLIMSYFRFAYREWTFWLTSDGSSLRLGLGPARAWLF